MPDTSSFSASVMGGTEAAPVAVRDLYETRKEESTEAIRLRVLEARERQERRYRGTAASVSLLFSAKPLLFAGIRAKSAARFLLSCLPSPFCGAAFFRADDGGRTD